MMKYLKFLPLLLLLAGCRTGESTASIPAVTPFDRQNYLGRWYEIGRMPHSFERGMNFVYAEYSLRPDGKIKVVNRGKRNGEQREIVGVAEMKGADDVGELRVSFFRPFYGDYRIIQLMDSDSIALVTSSTKNYGWILSRTPRISPEQLARALAFLRENGFDVDQMEYPEPCENNLSSSTI